MNQLSSTKMAFIPGKEEKEDHMLPQPRKFRHFAVLDCGSE